jgi:acyl-CoA dehydrogenase
LTAPADSAVTGRRHDEYVAQIAVFRQDFRRYLRELDVADQWRSAAFTSAEDGLAHDATVMARLYSDGWNRYGWPESAGGLGGNEIHRAVYYEELGYAMLPIPAQHWTLETLGPALLKFASHLGAQYLPGYLSGAEWWGQSFSEPESGSDLATLRTRAVYDGAGGFVLNGQKIWTSQGPTATRLLALVRTGAPESRHRGLTMMMVDADAPGVTIRPIALASGRRELAEVFFDDVRVDRERVVGDIDGGWAVAMHLMQYERGMYGYAVLNKVLTELSRLREDMVTAGSTAAQRQRFARVYVDVAAAQARTATTVRRLAAGEAVGADSSIDKLLFGRAERDVNDLVLEITRDHLIAGVGAGGAVLNTARAEWWYSRAATVMGGTAEVQRGIIADHLLGLPKERGK